MLLLQNIAEINLSPIDYESRGINVATDKIIYDFRLAFSDQDFNWVDQLVGLDLLNENPLQTLEVLLKIGQGLFSLLEWGTLVSCSDLNQQVEYSERKVEDAVTVEAFLVIRLDEGSYSKNVKCLNLAIIDNLIAEISKRATARINWLFAK